MDIIHVNAQGRLKQARSARHDEPVLLFGEHLLSQNKLLHDEVDGRTWSERVRSGPEVAWKIHDAVCDTVQVEVIAPKANEED